MFNNPRGFQRIRLGSELHDAEQLETNMKLLAELPCYEPEP